MNYCVECGRLAPLSFDRCESCALYFGLINQLPLIFDWGYICVFPDGGHVIATTIDVGAGLMPPGPFVGADESVFVPSIKIEVAVGSRRSYITCDFDASNDDEIMGASILVAVLGDNDAR